MNEQIDEELDLEDDKEEKLFNKEIEKQKSLALEESKVARDGFIAWYQDTIAKEVAWEHPATNWMYHAWIASHGVKKWESQESIEKRKRARAKQRETTIKNKALRAEKEKQNG
jgi:CRISPR/Cas system CMR subunit Cmr4 (Cas7 group RAMP superfamily)